MAKKDIDMVAMTPQKANAQNLTCFVAFVVSVLIAILMLCTAIALPLIVSASAVICWVCMALEAASAGLGFVAYWIQCNAL